MKVGGKEVPVVDKDAGKDAGEDAGGVLAEVKVIEIAERPKSEIEVG